MVGLRKAAQTVTRERLLDAAREQFALHGYLGANIRDIAAAAGRSTGAVFSNWKGKEDLFEAATGRKAPLNSVRDILTGAAFRGEVPALGSGAAQQLLIDLYGAL